jgi:hypothetical protein
LPEFIPGRELSGRFYRECVRPLLAAAFPRLDYAAALLGPGSDVLGFDSAMSTDHDWGPRFWLLLKAEDLGLRDQIDQLLRQSLPSSFAGYPVSISEPNGPHLPDHRIVINTLRNLVRDYLDYDLERDLSAADWLAISSQQLREMTTGAVHHDGSGELSALRERLRWYPHDLHLYLLASGWHRIAQEEHLMPRAGFMGDELGSSLMGARLVRDAMNLCFLYEQHYAPYPKWFGTAFKQLGCAAEFAALFPPVLRAQTWQARQSALCAIYSKLAVLHNRSGLTEALDPEPRPFHDRPFLVIDADRFARALTAQIRDPEVLAIVHKGLIGSIDQFSDSTDLRTHVRWRKPVRAFYQADSE